MLISEKQHAANCRNALLSAGPATPEGKAAVRLNALRYGLRARSLLLPGEDPAEFERLFAGLEADWRPQNQTERLLVEQMAVAQWKLARLEVGECSILAQSIPAERQMALLDRFSIQRNRLERSFSKAMQELQHLRKTNALARVPTPQPDKSTGRQPLTTGYSASGGGPLPLVSPRIMAPCVT
jgi:hypothetical protein